MAVPDPESHGLLEPLTTIAVAVAAWFGASFLGMFRAGRRYQEILTRLDGMDARDSERLKLLEYLRDKFDRHIEKGND